MSTTTLATAAALGGALLLVAPAASAVPTAVPARAHGTVTAPSGLNERAYPSTDSSVRGVLKYRAQVGLRCKAHAQEVGGNPLWYLLRERNDWIAARYIDNAGEVPLCRNLGHSSLDDSVESRAAMG
ncbi:SH3 domain-containing protein [Streptomyces sp. NPDC001262]|uniref:SH3 domain-containing protein n=1 Tax=Streptomyces TaxID=1883 RepID=UPI0036A84631